MCTRTHPSPPTDLWSSCQLRRQPRAHVAPRTVTTVPHVTCLHGHPRPPRHRTVLRRCGPRGPRLLSEGLSAGPDPLFSDIPAATGLRGIYFCHFCFRDSLSRPLSANGKRLSVRCKRRRCCVSCSPSLPPCAGVPSFLLLPVVSSSVPSLSLCSLLSCDASRCPATIKPLSVPSMGAAAWGAWPGRGRPCPPTPSTQMSGSSRAGSPWTQPSSPLRPLVIAFTFVSFAKTLDLAASTWERGPKR